LLRGFWTAPPRCRIGPPGRVPGPLPPRSDMSSGSTAGLWLPARRPSGPPARTLPRLESSVTSTTVKHARTPHSTGVEPTSEARLAAGREAARIASVIEPAERAGAGARLAMESSTAMERGGAMERGAAMEPGAAAVEMVAIDERAAVRDISAVVVDHDPAAPVGTPVAPSPTESGEDAEPETHSERNARTDCV